VPDAVMLDLADDACVPMVREAIDYWSG